MTMPDGSTIKIDRPHPPVGPHADIITPLESGIPGIQQIKIGPTGNIISEDFNISNR